MTSENEEAIKLLMELRICKDDCSVCKLRHLDGDTHCHHEKALNLAIKALEQEASETFQNAYDLGYEEGVDVGYTRGYTEAMSDIYEGHQT